MTTSEIPTMAIALATNKYKKLLEENVMLTDPFSPSAIRTLTLYLLLGKNYRLLTERNTKEKLFITYAWLSDIYDKAKKEFGDRWKERLLEEVLEMDVTTEEEKNLIFWLLGLTKKTANNLDISPDEFPDFLRQTISYCQELFSKFKHNLKEDQAWLLMMAGAATLNIRGSQKAKIGKSLEKTFLKGALTLLGLEFNKDFWINIERDLEVGRESDAEVETKRGRLRIDISLVASGNQEVIEDKINRVERQGVVICDKLGARSAVFKTAREKMVKLIQIRHNQPLVELYTHLLPLVKVQLKEPPQSEAPLQKLIDALPDTFFVLREARKT